MGIFPTTAAPWMDPNGRMDEVHRRRGVLRGLRLPHLGGVELGDGALRLEVNGADVSGGRERPQHGWLGAWTSLTVEDVVLFQGTQELVLHTVNAGHNVASMTQWTGETPPNLQFIPGVIQAEAYLEQLGTGLKPPPTKGRLKRRLDPGDYLGYQVEIESADPT